MRETTLPSVNTREFWEEYMATQWDDNFGRQQTRLFAKYFLDTVTLPADVRTLLDASCAKGDAIPEFHARYPNLKLFGADISEVAVNEACRCYGQLAQFHVAGFEDLSQDYDVIYCSNTLEHFKDYLVIASSLLEHCRWLYILVPYMELRGGKRLTPIPNEQHVATFDESSLNPLLERGLARNIETWVCYMPGAWGYGPVPLWRKLAGVLLRRPAPPDKRQIIYQIENVALNVSK